MKNESIRPIHIILLTMTVIGLKNHVTIIPPLLQHAGRNGWASVLLSSLALLPWVLLLLYVHKKSNQTEMKEWLKVRIGKVWAKVFNYVLAFFLITLAAFTMRETIHWISATFLLETPIYYLLIIYTVLCVMFASTSIKTIAITNVFVLFGVVIFGFFVAFANIQVKDYTLLRPFFEDGFKPVLFGMVYPASGMVELVLLLYLQHQVKGGIRFFHYIIIFFILTILTLGPLIGAITEFGPDEAMKQRYPAYEEWGLVTVTRFIEHLDFLSIYQWLTGAFIRVGILLFFVINLLNVTGKKKKIWGLVAPLFFIACTVLLMLEDQAFVNIKGNYFLLITFIFFLIVSLFFAIVSIGSGKSSRRTNT
ncbi:endospore germination permease [Pseudogracilibacillus auburnensis]|uniref:endospore germination permease n=1 Tax=Pseudogracilibacillus auburnensis TaxID=1494959 RepID=UPI001A9629BA|nr:endospore germination permease [Pseudogracilibacillus auburnensis]MBO1004029.1 endospore germination permease [Pseudogracilibacillus auburnensis]